MRAFVARLREVLPPGLGRRRRAATATAAAAQAPAVDEPLEPEPPRSPKPIDDLWPFEPYDNFVRPYVLSPEELYVYGMGGVPA